MGCGKKGYKPFSVAKRGKEGTRGKSFFLELCWAKLKGKNPYTLNRGQEVLNASDYRKDNPSPRLVNLGMLNFGWVGEGQGINNDSRHCIWKPMNSNLAHHTGALLHFMNRGAGGIIVEKISGDEDEMEEETNYEKFEEKTF